MRKHLPDANYFLNKNIPQLPDYSIYELIDSGNNAHVFKAYSQNVNNYIACKIIPKLNLIGIKKDPPTWRQEIDKANALKSQTVVRFWHVSEWRDQENNIDCVVLCSDYINGLNLEQFIKKKKSEILIPLIETYLKQLVALINDMENHEIIHGDIHSKNILVEDRTNQLDSPDYVFRVTDFGVSSATSEHHLRDDYDQIAAVLKLLLQNIDYQHLSGRDKFHFNFINDHLLAKHLIERDKTRDKYCQRPDQLYELICEIDSEFQKNQSKERVTKLNSLIDFLSCEQIGEDHLLLRALYSNKFLGLKEVESKSNLVLTGPRGCGKSTVFKSLSLKHRYMVGSDSPEFINYIGIYYRCDDLYFAFARYKNPTRSEAFDIPIHFLICTLFLEILDSIELWAKKYHEEEFSAKEEKVSSIIWENFSIEKPEAPGANSFAYIKSRLFKERKRAAEKQRFVHDEKIKIGIYFNPAIFINICSILNSKFSFLNDRPFYFFIDDYSSTKITIELQKNLNRILMQRTAFCFFKVSTESPVSYSREDIDGKAYIEGREFSLLNLGLVYLSSNQNDILKFLEDVFRKRFLALQNCQVYELEELLGSYAGPSHNAVALSIREGEKPELWGKQTIVQLCSGDIFYIISLVGRMMLLIGGEEKVNIIKEVPKISSRLQTKSIKGEAADFLTNLKGVKHGKRLVEIITAFGNVAFSYLKYRNSKNEEGNPPWLASRIEPYEGLSLSEDAQEIYDELLRYSIFIEDPRGKSRRGKVVPRLYLRRCLLPNFKLSFSKRDSIELENHELEQFLLNPKQFEKEQSWNVNKKEKKISKTQKTEQVNLFDKNES